MRVTKAIREYITKEVTKRIDHRYAAQREESELRHAIRDAFEQGCRDAAEIAYAKYFNDNFHRVADFCSAGSRYNLSWNDDSKQVHYWKCRRDEEVADIAAGIILELELGGSKALLMQKLEEID